MEFTNDKYLIKVKNKFYLKAVDKTTNVVIKKIFGITFRFARGSYYKCFVSFLNYIKPIGINIDEEILENFKKKSKKKYLNADIYLKDLELFRGIIDNIDPASLPKATGYLREKQIRELNFTKEIMNDLEKNTDIKPFMDDGTLLGAIRHKGFIPWDDDVDFSLMRDDFEKLKKYFKTRYRWIDTDEWHNNNFNSKIRKILKQYPNEVVCLKRPTSLKCFKLIDGEVAFCDFFALDCYSDDFNLNSFNEYIRDVIKRRPNLKAFSEIFDFYMSETDKSSAIVKQSDKIYAGIDNYDFYYYKPLKFRTQDDIFPLKKIKFEDTEFWAPNNEINCLESIYDDYKKLPLLIMIENHRIKKV